MSNTSIVYITNTNNAATSNPLDRIPDSGWFFCLPLGMAVFCICALGILHPFFWCKVMRCYRSEIFVFMYVLVVFWAVLSCALLYAIFAESHCLYSFWIWYTIAFCLVMGALMFLLFCGFCVLGMRRKSVMALLGLVYYLTTLYCTAVVNQQRKLVFGLNANCASCALRHLRSNNDTDYLRSRQDNSSYPMLWNTQYTQGWETRATWTAARLTTETLNMMPSFIATMAPSIATMAPSIATVTPYIASATMTPYIARLLYKDDNTTKQPNMTQITFRDPDLPKRTVIPGTIGTDREAAIAMLTELLTNSDECRKPRKPAHGKYHVSDRIRKLSLKLTLHCDFGYRASSNTTTCKANWWDSPLPQCRQRKPPDPVPYPGGNCIMPGYPAHGEYRVVDHPRARPGDRVSSDNVVLEVSCDEPYRAVDPLVICVEGKWRHPLPTCLKHCKLTFEPNVDYKCLKAFKDEFQTCMDWQPDGAVVVASCKPGYAHRGPFRYMRCHGDTWDHTVSCKACSKFSSSHDDPQLIK